jgi:hypothetical protein
MKSEFEALAYDVKNTLESRIRIELLQKDYIYTELNRMIAEWTTGKFTSVETEIGMAAIKTFDSGLSDDRELNSRILKLEKLFNRKVSAP